MGPSPITVSHRLVYRYTVGTFPHRHVEFVNLTPTGDPTGFSTIPVNGGASQGCSLLADALFGVLDVWYNSTTVTFDAMDIEERSGDTWIPITSVVPTAVPTSSTAYTTAFGVDISGKNENNHSIHAYFYEMSIAKSFKYVAYSSMSADYKELVDFFYNVGGSTPATSAYYWAVSRDEYWRNRFLSVVGDSNEKLRRMRGIK